MKPHTRVAIIRRTQRALKELELSLVTKADKTRLYRIWKGLHALDDEQAELKYAIEDLLKSYSKKGGSIGAIVNGLKKLVEKHE